MVAAPQEVEAAVAEIERRLSKPDSKTGRTQRLVLRFVAGHEHPTSVRFVFYELEQQGDARKPAEDDDRRNRRRSHGLPPGEQDIIDALRDLRERGIVPWDWIADETRHLSTWLHARTVDGNMADRLPEARINPWGTPPPLILCESRATAGVLERVTAEYVCPVTGTSGQVAGFLHTDVAPLFEDALDRPVLYLGDLDFSGAHIEANTRRVLEAEAGVELDWRRLGMTERQARRRNIEPIRKRDGRTRQWHDAIEVEALGRPASSPSSVTPSTPDSPSRSATFWNVNAKSATRSPAE